MYSKNSFLLFGVNTVLTAGLMLSRGGIVQGVEPAAFQVENTVDAVIKEQLVRVVEPEPRASTRRVITYKDLTPDYCIAVSQQDIETLMKIVEAEAGGEDRQGKLLVANVVINRVKSGRFPDSVTAVVYQKSQNVAQFSPVANGTINSVTVSEETREVVFSALRGEDVSKGAMYFMARRYAAAENVSWFDNHLTFLFSYGGHDFYAP
ncbi:MAG: cell wall hydrolase [Roseburia sp.]|nr:cell wall hydrolase [Roseburia sp.]